MNSKWVSSRVVGVVVTAAVTSVIALGCGSDDDGNGNGSGANGQGARAGNPSLSGSGGAAAGSSGGLGATNSGGSSATGNASSVGGSGNVAGQTAACRGLPLEAQGGEGGGQGEVCAGVSNEAEAVPVDLFMMIDRSMSMTELVAGSTTQTRWDALHEAVRGFVEGGDLEDVGLGIGFFGLSTGADDAIDCDVDRYAEPVVAIGPVPDVSAEVVETIDATGSRLGGLTPTIPALQGALQYAKEYSADNAGRATVVVLVTDGFPTQCGNMVSAIADAAREGRENEPFVRTFVIGIAAGFNLNSIAQAGGTDRAFIVDEANAVDSFRDALVNISNSALACDYALPPPPDGSQVVNPERVQVVYTPAVGEPEEVPRITGLGACGINPNGGWYYDNPMAPSRILVCPCTCQRFAAGRVDIRVGCSPRVGLR